LIAHDTLIAADPPEFRSQPPGMGEVQFVGDILVVSRGIPMSIPEERLGKRKVGDKVEAYTFKVMRTVTMPSEEAVAAANYRVRDMQGKPVDAALLAQRFSEPTPVLILDSSQPVDPRYLVLYRPSTLVVYLRPDRPRPLQMPPPGVMPPGAMPPAPAPVAGPTPMGAG
jgi:hypothetical protein